MNSFVLQGLEQGQGEGDKLEFVFVHIGLHGAFKLIPIVLFRSVQRLGPCVVDALHHIPITSYAAKREILCRGEEGALFLVYPHLFKEKKEKGCTAVCLQGQLRWVKGCLKPSHTLLE
eukprot:1141432-Pelagomonas_calceolata.AAC.11